MPWQLIYTSAPRGLLSGQSGFCTVARSADLREALVQRLEQISSYHYLRVAEAATANRNPAISAFRLLDLRGAKYYVLTRIQPCGLDFTARTNHLAHHLVFQPEELAALPSPAALLRHWPGWLASWQGEPRLLEETDPAGLAAAAKTFLPAKTWTRLTGDGGRAAGLLESECVGGCYLLCPPGSEEQVLEMFCETLQLLNFNGQFPLRPWRHTFTAFLQAEDNPNDFQWRGCQADTPAYKQALTRSAPMIALRSVRVPANSLVKLAREAPKPPSVPRATPPPPASGLPAKSNLALRRETSSRPISPPAPRIESVNMNKPARTEKPAFLNLNFSINSATLMRLGIPAAVLLALLLVQHYSTHRPLEKAPLAPVPARATAPPAKSEPPPKASPPAVAAPPTTIPPAAYPPPANQLDGLAGDWPTYLVTVPNLSRFSVPIESNLRIKRLLTNYFNIYTLHTNIHLTVNTNQWDFQRRETQMAVDAPTKDFKFSASGGGLVFSLDCQDWWLQGANSLTANVTMDSSARALSLQFSSTTDDPFRLLMVSENNPPEPLHLVKEFVHNDFQGLLAKLKGSFIFLDGRQLRYQLLTKTASQPAQYLYKNWPANDVPASGHELDFAVARQHLQAHQKQCEKRQERLVEFLGLPLGQFLGSTNSKLESFPVFAHQELTQRKFAEYLTNLRNPAPPNSPWIINWPKVSDSDAPDEAAAKFAKIYDLWSKNSPQDESKLTLIFNKAETNYFFAAWQCLQETEFLQDQLDQLKKRFDELDRAYVALCVVDPKQSKPGLEMIRFEGP
jgi:hypothetical protein